MLKGWGTFIYGYPHHHLQKSLWDQISNIPDTGTKPWLILGDLNELSSLEEKISVQKCNSTRHNNFNTFIIITILLIYVLQVIFIHGITKDKIMRLSFLG